MVLGFSFLFVAVMTGPAMMIARVVVRGLGF